jgi:uncharacterized phage protein gp47/JayE
MPDFGVQSQGFVLKRLADILDDMVAELSLVQDPVTGEFLTPNLSDENDPLVQLVNSVADQLAVGWEQLQLAYNQFDPLKATGAGLSGLVQLNGIRRKAGFPSSVQLTVTGTPGKVVAAGRQVSTIDDSVVFTLPAFTIGGGGTVSVQAVATEDGPLEAAAGTVVKILTPVAGWSAVTNPTDAVPGEAEQDDTSLRELQRLSTENTGRGMIEDLFSAINTITGLTFAKAYQNTSLLEDERGIPGKTVAPIVQGGDVDEIAQAIFSHMPIGVDTFGSIETTITDEQGFDYTIRFDRPTAIPIFIAVEIDPFSPTWPTDGADLIKQAIVNYALENYLPGVSVYASQLFTPANSIAGAQIVSLVIGTADPPADQIVSIDWGELASFSVDNIEVTEV